MNFSDIEAHQGLPVEPSDVKHEPNEAPGPAPASPAVVHTAKVPAIIPVQDPAARRPAEFHDFFSTQEDDVSGSIHLSSVPADTVTSNDDMAAPPNAPAQAPPSLSNAALVASDPRYSEGPHHDLFLTQEDENAESAFFTETTGPGTASNDLSRWQDNVPDVEDCDPEALDTADPPRPTCSKVVNQPTTAPVEVTPRLPEFLISPDEYRQVAATTPLSPPLKGGSSSSASLPPLSVFPDGDFVTVTDRETRRLVLPKSALRATRAEQREGLAAICLLYLNENCRMGANCRQVHADRDVVQRARETTGGIVLPCCGAHGDPAHSRKPAEMAQLHFDVHGFLVSGHHIAYTLCMLRLVEEARAASTRRQQLATETTTPAASSSSAGPFTLDPPHAQGSGSNPAALPAAAQEEPLRPRCSIQAVCVNHASKGACRYGARCNFLHVCRQIIDKHLAKLMEPLPPVAPGPARRAEPAGTTPPPHRSLSDSVASTPPSVSPAKQQPTSTRSPAGPRLFAASPPGFAPISLSNESGGGTMLTMSHLTPGSTPPSAGANISVFSAQQHVTVSVGVDGSRRLSRTNQGLTAAAPSFGVVAQHQHPYHDHSFQPLSIPHAVSQSAPVYGSNPAQPSFVPAPQAQPFYTASAPFQSSAPVATTSFYSPPIASPLGASGVFTNSSQGATTFHSFGHSNATAVPSLAYTSHTSNNNPNFHAMTTGLQPPTTTTYGATFAPRGDNRMVSQAVPSTAMYYGPGPSTQVMIASTAETAMAQMQSAMPPQLHPEQLGSYVLRSAEVPVGAPSAVSMPVHGANIAPLPSQLPHQAQPFALQAAGAATSHVVWSQQHGQYVQHAPYFPATTTTSSTTASAGHPAAQATVYYVASPLPPFSPTQGRPPT